MATLLALNTAIKNRLATIAGLHATTECPAQVRVPAAWPQAVENSFHESQGGTEMTTFSVTVLAMPVGSGYERGQQELDAYLASSGSKSIKAAIEADDSLGGVAHTLAVPRWYDRGQIDAGESVFWGAKLEVVVYHS